MQLCTLYCSGDGVSRSLACVHTQARLWHGGSRRRVYLCLCDATSLGRPICVHVCGSAGPGVMPVQDGGHMFGPLGSVCLCVLMCPSVCVQAPRVRVGGGRECGPQRHTLCWSAGPCPKWGAAALRAPGGYLPSPECCLSVRRRAAGCTELFSHQ